MEYKLITVSFFLSSKGALEKLAQAVNDAIALGWEPLGGPVVFDKRGRIVQAMLKRR